MNVPFTVDQFLDVFRRYNEAVWPSQWLLHALALTVIVLALRGRPHAGRTVSGILAFLWLWAAVIYHLAFFSSIDGAALLFAALFLLEAVLLFAIGVSRGRLAFRVRADGAGLAGAAMVVYALIVYPLLGYGFGHHYPASPTFGVPCPTTIFTLGILLWAAPPVPWSVLVVPIVWAVVATVAALDLGMREDLGLTLAAIVTPGVTWLRGRRERRRANETTNAPLPTGREA